ncbi:MAG TPA: transposase [Armatimonadetes bacterium]|nr:transposase [Armatimonadota bacterium]
MRLEKLKEPINMTEVLRFEGEVKSVTLSEEAGHWYASINVEVQPPKHKHPQEAVGVDLGLNTLLFFRMAGG